MVTYHYVKFYVSIIIQLEVININVRNYQHDVDNSYGPDKLRWEEAEAEAKEKNPTKTICLPSFSLNIN